MTGSKETVLQSQDAYTIFRASVILSISSRVIAARLDRRSLLEQAIAVQHCFMLLNRHGFQAMLCDMMLWICCLMVMIEVMLLWCDARMMMQCEFLLRYVRIWNIYCYMMMKNDDYLLLSGVCCTLSLSYTMF